MTLRRAVRLAVAVGWASVPIAAARGQTIDVERPRLFVVGSPSVRAMTTGPNSCPAGVSAARLPSASLRTEWSASLGISIERPPVVDARGIIYVLGERGDVVAVSQTGEELWRLATAFSQPGPAAVLSDDTIVFVDVNGEAVAVRDRSVRWHAKFARGDPTRPIPLALDDGGVIVAAGNEIAMLDSEGHERARLALPELTSALVATASAQIAIVTANGTIWTWAPGAIDATRVASFGAAVDGGAVLGSGHVLFAVTAGAARVVTADLDDGTVTTRASAGGSLWLGPPAVRGEIVSLLALTAAGEVALAFDGSGSEIGQTWIGSSAISTLDGGIALRGPLPRVPPLVDQEGTVVFAAADGALGVVAGLGSGHPTVQRIPDACPPPLGTRLAADPSLVGIVPIRHGTFLGACRWGTLLAIRGDAAGGTENGAAKKAQERVGNGTPKK